MKEMGWTVEYVDYVTFVEPIRHRMVNSIWKIVRDPEDTDDVLQDVLLRVAQKVASIRKHPNPTALILRMCINLAIDSRRKTGCRIRHLNPGASVERLRTKTPSPSDQILWQERQEQVLAAIHDLPPRQAESIILLAIEDFSYPEIAQAMGCRESTVRVLVSKARKRLKAAMLSEEAMDIPQIVETEA